MKKIKFKNISLMVILMTIFYSTQSFCGYEKKGHLFQTFGLFTEEGQSAFYNRGGQNYWAEIASKIPLFGVDNFQVVANAGIQASLRKSGKEFNSDTIDVRIGLAGLFLLTPSTRFMFAVSHLSGHVLEDVPDKVLLPINVGDDTVQFRLLHDFGKSARIGGTLKYVLGSEQTMKKLQLDEFFEWFPLTERSHATNPYIAVGFEEYGFGSYVLTSHVQTGIYWGSHLDPHHNEIIRLSLGAYSGLDPRQKYSHYFQDRSKFGYLGFAYEY